MPWRIIEVNEEKDSDLTDSELVAISISLANHADGENVYGRVWKKIQPAVEIANSK